MAGRRVSSSCPSLVLLVLAVVLLLSSGRSGQPCVPLFSCPLGTCSCPSSGLLRPRLLAYLRLYSSHHRLAFLLSSLPLIVLFSSWHAPLMCLSGHSLSFFCPPGVFMLPSFPHPFVLCCPPYVLLWSFCCPAAVVPFVAFRGRPTTTMILAD